MGHFGNYENKFKQAGPEWINYLEQLRAVKRSILTKLGEEPPAVMQATSDFGQESRMPLMLPLEPSTPGSPDARIKADRLKEKIQKLHACL